MGVRYPPPTQLGSGSLLPPLDLFGRTVLVHLRPLRAAAAGDRARPDVGAEVAVDDPHTDVDADTYQQSPTSIGVCVPLPGSPGRSPRWAGPRTGPPRDWLDSSSAIRTSSAASCRCSRSDAVRDVILPAADESSSKAATAARSSASLGVAPVPIPARSRPRRRGVGGASASAYSSAEATGIDGNVFVWHRKYRYYTHTASDGRRHPSTTEPARNDADERAGRPRSVGTLGRTRQLGSDEIPLVVGHRRIGHPHRLAPVVADGYASEMGVADERWGQQHVASARATRDRRVILFADPHPVVIGGRPTPSRLRSAAIRASGTPSSTASTIRRTTW